MSYEDLQHALAGTRRCVEQEAGKWRVYGEDLDGVELSAVVMIEEDVFVVTVF